MSDAADDLMFREMGLSGFDPFEMKVKTKPEKPWHNISCQIAVKLMSHTTCPQNVRLIANALKAAYEDGYKDGGSYDD